MFGSISLLRTYQFLTSTTRTSGDVVERDGVYLANSPFITVMDGEKVEKKKDPIQDYW